MAAWAAASVPRDRSAQRRRVRLAAPAIIPLCLAAPFLGGGAAAAAAALIALAVALRVLALVHVLRAPLRRDDPEPERLPRITILLPLKLEARVVAGLAASIHRLDYPAHLVEVIALLEEGDFATLSALRRCAPPRWRLVILPDGRPRNKPRACNVGLALATGDVIAIFDGEDRPEADQARKAVAALAADPRVAVVQARLGCDHAGAGRPLLERCWGLEYDVLFGAVQPALARIGLPFLLGGTSNWFRAEALRNVGGWDAHNVTEDADLGVRLARAGWASSVIDSTTWEEAPVGLGQWIRQRSRWLKGFAVTTAAHLSRPLLLGRELGLRGMLAILAQLPATLVCAAAHPLGLVLLVTLRLEGLILALAVTAYAIPIALHGVVARRNGTPVWLALAMPVYWLLQSAALLLAFADLIRDPTHWRKTEHGFAERPESLPAARLTAVETAIRAEASALRPAANAPHKPAAVLVE